MSGEESLEQRSAKTCGPMSVVGDSRRVKIFQGTEGVEFAMMDSLHGEQKMGASAGICNRARKPTVAVTERVPSGGEPRPTSAPAKAAASIGCGTVHAR